MMHGIRVIWPGENDDPANPVEIEYFYGIDTDQLNEIDEILPFDTVPAMWPQDGTLIEYTVDAHCKHPGPGEVHLVVRYERTQNLKLVRKWGEEFHWGTNTIVLKRGSRKGICRWQRDGADPEEVAWAAFDLGANQARPRAVYLGSMRQARFRTMILNCDKRRCVLTGDETIQALDASHLIPAAMGENDIPFNGITLRADLHRLFDTCLFTFAADGRVVVPERQPGLSEAYIQLLQNARLSRATWRRVRAVLASPEFQNRCP